MDRPIRLDTDPARIGGTRRQGRCLLAAAVLSLWVGSGSAATGDDARLTVTVEKALNRDGFIVVALFDSRDSFLENILTDRAVEIGEDGTARVTFDGLAPGTYAVSAYHDENANDRLDQGMFGIPIENYAFSNHARVLMAPPDWEDARIELEPGDAEITIRLGEH